MDPRITLSVKSYLNFCWAILKLRILVQLSEWRDVPFFWQGRAILWCPWMMVLILFQCEKINKTYQPPLSPPQKKQQRAFRKQITQRAYAKMRACMDAGTSSAPTGFMVLVQHQQLPKTQGLHGWERGYMDAGTFSAPAMFMVLVSTNKHNVHMFSNVFLRVLNIYR